MKTAPQENARPKLTLTHIEAREDLRRFSCGVDEIDRWARDKAHKLHDRGRARVTVARTVGGAAPCGFYSLTNQVAETSKLLRHEDRDVWDNAPIVYIGWIAVARQRQGAGIGRTMLVHALRNAWRLHDIAPIYGVGLRALDGRVEDFYARSGFRRAPNEDGRHPLMILPVWTLDDLFAPPP